MNIETDALWHCGAASHWPSTEKSFGSLTGLWRIVVNYRRDRRPNLPTCRATVARGSQWRSPPQSGSSSTILTSAARKRLRPAPIRPLLRHAVRRDVGLAAATRAQEIFGRDKPRDRRTKCEGISPPAERHYGVAAQATARWPVSLHDLNLSHRG